MSLSVNTNVTSMTAQNSLARTQSALSTSFARLSSGLRINTAADDAAGLGVAKSMNAQVRSYAVAERNTNDAISMLQTADGGAEQIHSLLTRMRELAVQSANGSYSVDDRTNIQAEFQQDQDEIQRVAGSVQFNGKNLLGGSTATTTFQVGIGTASSDSIGVTFGGADADKLGVSAASISVTTDTGAASSITAIDAAIKQLSAQRANFGASISVDTDTGAALSITAIDAAMKQLSAQRANFGAGMNRFQSTVENLQSMQTNTAASLSRIQDTDVAKETAALSKNQVLSQAGAAILAQANQTPQLAMSLLR